MVVLMAPHQLHKVMQRCLILISKFWKFPPLICEMVTRVGILLFKHQATNNRGKNTLGKVLSDYTQVTGPGLYFYSNALATWFYIWWAEARVQCLGCNALLWESITQHSYQGRPVSIKYTSGCPWPSATVKSPGFSFL